MTTKAQSVHAGAMLLQMLSSDERLMAKIEGAKNYSDFLGLALTEGFDLSGLSEQEAIALAKGDRAALGEISEADLAQVAGGTPADSQAHAEQFTFPLDFWHLPWTSTYPEPTW